jgi:hypothetical protein
MPAPSRTNSTQKGFLSAVRRRWAARWRPRFPGRRHNQDQRQRRQDGAHRATKQRGSATRAQSSPTTDILRHGRHLPALGCRRRCWTWRPGELRGVRLRMPPTAVVEFLSSLPGPVRAVYEAGPTGFGLTRAAIDRGIDVCVVAAGKVPRASGDGVKTDRRDAERLARLLAAGELRFAFVPSIADEQFCDVIRAIEDCRGDLMRGRHRLSKFLLRRDLRWTGPGSARTQARMRWLRTPGLRRPLLAGHVDRLPLGGRDAAGPSRGLVGPGAGDPRQQSRRDDRAAALLPGHRHAPGRRAVRRGRRTHGPFDPRSSRGF